MSIHEISICESDHSFLDLAGRRKAITCKVRNMIDRHGIDIFRSGSATKPKNPYFVAKIIAKRRNQQVIKPIIIY